MGLYQSYLEAFVTNSPTLLANGSTVDNIAVGQIGIIDAKTNLAVTAPTYANNKALKIVWGTPHIDLGLMGGIPNENIYSKLIKGKLIRGFRGKKAQHAQTPLWTVGWSGDVSDTDTLSAKAGEAKHLYIHLSGTIIDRLYSTQGVTKLFLTTPPCTDDCSLGCDVQDCTTVADQLVHQINQDKDFRRFIRAKAIKSCTSSASTNTCYVFELTVCDTGDDLALGLVQGQYPAETVVRSSRSGSASTYQVIKTTNSAPADFSNAGIVFIPDCPTCPAGYTAVTSKFVYQVTRVDDGDATALTAVKTDYAIAGAETGVRTNYQFGTSTYILASTPELTADGTDNLTLLGSTRYSCVLTTPTEVAWVAGTNLENVERTVRLTIGDTICGDTRLAELQAAYPDLTVSLVDADGDCVHTYETTITSDCYLPGCAIEDAHFTMPAVFEGVSWVLQPLDDDTTDCLCGIMIESAFFNNETNECTFDALSYENDVVHVQISNYNPDFNAVPCEETDWAVKQIRQVKYPQGTGAWIQRLEKDTKSYALLERSYEPLVRQQQGYQFVAQQGVFYDEYVINFETKWKTSGGWAEEYNQTFDLHVFFPEGTGAAFETAINTYLQSAGILEEPVVL